MNGSPTTVMPVETMILLFTLAAEPRPTPRPDAEVSLELLEFLGDVDAAPAWVRDDPTPPPSAPDAAPSTPSTRETKEQTP